MTHTDWLINGLKKVILPSQEIQLARSCKHCTNKNLKEIIFIGFHGPDDTYEKPPAILSRTDLALG